MLCGVFAEFKLEIIRERVNVGYARARDRGALSASAPQRILQAA